MIYCYFTYKDDMALLVRSIESVRLADPTAKIAVFDDSSNPLPKDPVADYCVRTNFARNGNLNGLPCVEGILNCFKEACEHFGETKITKVDSDVILIKPAPLSDLPFWGCELYHNMTAAGPCYALTLDCVNAILTDLKSRTWLNERFPEDETISRMSLSRGGVIAPESNKHIVQGYPWMGEDHLAELKAWADLPSSIAVHFGVVTTNKYTKDDIAKTMAQFINKLQP